MNRTLATTDALIAAGYVQPDERTAIDAVIRRYAVAITPAMQTQIDQSDDPIGLQFIPNVAELLTAPHETADPIGDDAFSPIKGVVHRYPDRALLKPLLVCPVYCRFCFRREHVGPDGGLLSEAELQAAYAWFAARPAIREVILTGGDPLMLSPRRLASIVNALSGIPHIEMLRVHTRVPTADPARVTETLADALETSKSMWVVLHANHPCELTGEAIGALRRIQARAVPVLGQSVLLRGVNDDAATLEALFRAMLAARVKPVLSAPARSRARHSPFPRTYRRRPPFACAAPRPCDRPGMADICARHPRRTRQGADRSGLSGTG